MALLEIVFRANAGSPRSFTVGNDTGGVMRIGAIGSGGAGGTGGLTFVGGSGKGGSYAERTNQAVSNGDVLTLNIAPTVATGNGNVSTVVRSGVTLVSARGGSAGANAGTLNNGAGGTAAVGTFVGDIEFLGGNGANGSYNGGGGAGTLEAGGAAATAGGPGLGGQKFGGNGAENDEGNTEAQQGGGGGAGQATLTTGQRAGAAGLVVLAYSTGVGSIGHTAQFNRLATLSRLGLASITHTAVFDRLVTVRRAFTNSITHSARALKTIKIPRIASITHTARQTVKKVRLTRTVSIAHAARLRRAIEFLRTASITHTAGFQRLVTLRRRFTASITHRARQLMKLEGRLIPREGGSTIVNNIRNFFTFDD